jgi:alpha-beta hydrolase superfamily lysophospholipase
MRALEPRVPQLKLPLYVMHGMRDLTTSFSAVDDFVRRAGSTDVTFIKVEGGSARRVEPTGRGWQRGGPGAC